MENEIEEKLEEIYRDYVDVEFIDFGIYDVFLTLKYGKIISIRFLYNSRMTFENNLRNIVTKLDSEIVKIFKR